uniref:EamA domain-containing protein n=1 Tax=Heterorhabditis bacteriophora TaxID=37862 RepID=A0A1I7X3P7_HETBA
MGAEDLLDEGFPFMKYLLVIKVLISIVGVISSVTLLYRKGTKWLIRPNARMIYAIHMIWVI